MRVVAVKDYHAFAREWLEKRGLGLGTVATFDEHAAALGDALEEAYEEGRRAEAKRIASSDFERGGSSAPQGSFDSVVLARQREELTQKTIKIIGSGRSVDVLRNVPHVRRAVALHAGVDVRVLRDFLEGRSVSVVDADRIEGSLFELGYSGSSSAGKKDET